ncbi:sterile alpha motif domain-containing protein 9-like isoform 1-T2 [Menidia menidia]
MARRPAFSSATDEQMYADETRDSSLDIVCANQFEGLEVEQNVAEQIEEDFYRGAPPVWLNFHISEEAERDGSGSSFVKRDGYERLLQQINNKWKGQGTSVVTLFHQQGSGGTTLAMQVLWNLRKTFRCAVLTDLTTDIMKVAKEVVHLFKAGTRNIHKTVLLLLDDTFNLNQLQDIIMEEVTEQKLDVDTPVVILLSCVRTDRAIPDKGRSDRETQGFNMIDENNVVLKNNLSDAEKLQFDAKKKELSTKYGDKVKQFYGFNILQSNFSWEYVQEVCAIFAKMERKKKPLKSQLAAFLSLLNAYVPGSYLLESHCLDFLRHDDDDHDVLPLLEQMQPFSYLIITLKHKEKYDRKVRMAHPLIAKGCTQLLADGGIPRSDTARNFLLKFCRDYLSPCLLSFITHMLTKREIKRDERTGEKDGCNHRPMDENERLEKFSTLVLHISKMEDKRESASVLKVASNVFANNALFPQALSRFYYGELKNYQEGEIWAKTAKERDPKKSFIADTLGQVHKNHLKSKTCPAEPREVLHLARKAIEAFEEEEQLARTEHWKNMQEDGKTKNLRELNIRGQIGFLQVCNILFDQLVSHNETWREVLTGKVSMGSVLRTFGDRKLFRFNYLIEKLRGRVEEKFEFLDTFLTYSESVMKKDRAYVSKEAAECYRKYVGGTVPKHKEKHEENVQKLKQKLAFSSAGILSCLDGRCTRSDVREILKWWEEICQGTNFKVCHFVNFILAKIMLKNLNEQLPSFDDKGALRQKKLPSSDEQTEYHMLALLLFWPTDDEEQPASDLHQLINHIKSSYTREYKTMFGSRYLRPLFFIGPGKELSRFVHRRILEIKWTQDVLQDPKVNWRSEIIFKDPVVQDQLLKVKGVVRDYRLYATFGSTEIEVKANRSDGLWKSGEVSFYLGFNINGPTAFNIQRRFPVSEGPSGKLQLGERAIEPSLWTKCTPEVKTGDRLEMYSLRSDGGFFECAVSALRWVCKEPISLEYRFCSWEEHTEKPVCMGLMPAGPLIDISVTSGKLEEVHLPHWIDTESTSPDMFVVLHVEACGEAVQQVSGVTSSHVKLLQPSFSPNGVMLRKILGLPVKVYCDVMLYKTKLEFLTLHFYLVPPDQHLKQRVESDESRHQSLLIRKPSPYKSLQLKDHFFLKCDTDTAEIQPKSLKVKYKSNTFLEVFIRNACDDFSLTLRTGERNDTEEVWKCTIRKGDFLNPSMGHSKDQHFVDINRTALVNGVRDTPHVLDKLLELNLISTEAYTKISDITHKHDQMREILIHVWSGGTDAKDRFLEILKGMKNLRSLLSSLEEC